MSRFGSVCVLWILKKVLISLSPPSKSENSCQIAPSLHSLAVFKRGNRDNKPQSCEEPGRETSRFTRARRIA